MRQMRGQKWIIIWNCLASNKIRFHVSRIYKLKKKRTSLKDVFQLYLMCLDSIFRYAEYRNLSFQTKLHLNATIHLVPNAKQIAENTCEKYLSISFRDIIFASVFHVRRRYLSLKIFRKRINNQHVYRKNKREIFRCSFFAGQVKRFRRHRFYLELPAEYLRRSAIHAMRYTVQSYR